MEGADVLVEEDKHPNPKGQELRLADEKATADKSCPDVLTLMSDSNL